jgi:hypothetical protein
MLETRNVFIDTQYFVEKNFNFHSPSFISLNKLCKANELRYFTTSVVEREIVNKIKSSINEALDSLKNTKRKANLLSTTDDKHIKPLFTDVRGEHFYEKAISVFHEYIESCNCEYIEADLVDVERLLSLYFDEKPPFGKAKKKSEFPDAISLLSLESYFKDNEKIYIVSNDIDLKTYCVDNDRFISIKSLDELLDLYNEHTDVRTEKIKEHISDSQTELKQHISDYLSNFGIYNSSSWEDSEVEDFSVTSVGDIEPSIIEVDDERCHLSFDVNVDIKVIVTGPNYNDGIYDKEDDKWYTYESTTREETLTIKVSVELDLTYEYEDGAIEGVDWEDLSISIPTADIEVSVEENETPDWH